MVRHHRRRESVACRGYEDACELWEEEVGVGGDRIVKASLAEGEESIILGRGSLDGASAELSFALGTVRAPTVLSGRAL